MCTVNPWLEHAFGPHFVSHSGLAFRQAALHEYQHVFIRKIETLRLGYVEPVPMTYILITQTS